MTGAAWLQIVLGALSVAGLAVSGWLTYRGTTRAKQIESTATPYDQLAERVGTLETQVGDLLASQHEDRMYIRVLIAERPRGWPLPEPIPAWVMNGYRRRPPDAPHSIIEPPVRGPIDNP